MIGPIAATDYHAGGEPFRIVTDGAPEAGGSTVLERRRWIAEHADHVRRMLVFEPRGHADMYGGFVTPPDDDGADLGVVFFHNEGYSTACGHGTIALVTWAIETGRLRVGSGVRRGRRDGRRAVRETGLHGADLPRRAGGSRPVPERSGVRARHGRRGAVVAWTPIAGHRVRRRVLRVHRCPHSRTARDGRGPARPDRAAARTAAGPGRRRGRAPSGCAGSARDLWGHLLGARRGAPRPRWRVPSRRSDRGSAPAQRDGVR